MAETVDLVTKPLAIRRVESVEFGGEADGGIEVEHVEESLRRVALKAVLLFVPGLVNALDSEPKNFKATAYDTKIVLEWSEKLGIDSYLLAWKAEDEDNFTEITLPKSATSYTIEDATPEMQYTIVLKAEKGGEYSPEVTQTVTTLNKVDAVYVRLKTENQSAFAVS